MKIQDIQNNQQSIALQNRPNVGGSSFQALLESKLQGVGMVHNLQETSLSQPVTGGVPAALRLDSLSLAEQTMSTLEQFETGLQNPAFQAHELEPLVANLELNTAAILDLKQQLPADDPLNRLVDRVAAVAYVEVYKFRRGDYAV